LDAKSNHDPEQRRWTIAPAILRETGETLPGMPVLEEFPDYRGALIFLALHDVLLWSEVAPDERPDLFAPGAGERRRRLGVPGVELLKAWTRFSALVAGPGLVQAAELTAACLQVAAWASQRGALRTALAFTQAAATLQPGSGTAALATGQAAMAAGQATRARAWLRRSIGLARRGGEWDAYAAAYVELARLDRAEGRPAAARANLHKAQRAGRRHGLPLVRGEAFRLLSHLARDEGADDVGDVLALRAARRCRAEARRGPPSASSLRARGCSWAEPSARCRCSPSSAAVSIPLRSGPNCWRCSPAARHRQATAIGFAWPGRACGTPFGSSRPAPCLRTSSTT
jgi:hypothetical protein